MQICQIHVPCTSALSQIKQITLFGFLRRRRRKVASLLSAERVVVF
jgi:hypothetical protein